MCEVHSLVGFSQYYYKHGPDIDSAVLQIWPKAVIMTYCNAGVSGL